MRALASAAVSFACTRYTASDPDVRTLSTLTCQKRERESFLLTTYWSGSTDVFGGPASRHGSLNSLFQVALYLPSKRHLCLIRRPTLALIKDLRQGTARQNYFKSRLHTAHMEVTKSQTKKYQKIEAVGSNGLHVLHEALKSLSLTVICLGLKVDSLGLGLKGKGPEIASPDPGCFSHASQ